MPLVSVIVPAHNAEQTILNTVRSVQNQTLSDLEILVVNDGSTDATLEKLATISDPRLRVFTYENAGQAIARNRGMAQATGQFLSFIDSDDLWTPDKLEAQLAALENFPEAAVAYSWTAFIDERDRILYRYDPTPFHGNVYPHLLIENFIASGSNILVRRECAESIQGFQPERRSVEDWDYYLRLAEKYPFALVPKYQILYRRSDRSETACVEDREREGLAFVHQVFETVPDELKSLKSQSLAHAYRFYSVLYLSFGLSRERIRKAFQRVRTAIKLHPKLLLERKTQRLLIKVLLLHLVTT